MKNNSIRYKILSVLIIPLFMSTAMHAQDIRVFTLLGSGIFSVNNSGNGIANARYYDYASNSFTLKESDITNLYRINNNGDVAASIKMTENTSWKQPAYKLASEGQWKRIGWFPESTPSNSSFDVGAISSNGKYVVGNMSVASTNWGAYLYNTETNTFTKILDENKEVYEAIRVLGVNDNGIMVGWVDQVGNGTIRIPMYMDANDMIIHELEFANPTSIMNMSFSISNTNIIVGTRDGFAFSYNINTQEYRNFPLPDGAINCYFQDISDTGVAVGYAILSPGTYEAIIYDPERDNENLLYLKDILADAGATYTTFDGKLGTAASISDNGRFIGGFCNGGSTTTFGWIIDMQENTMHTQDTDVNQIKIYPNPTTDYFQLKGAKSNSTITIYGLDGRALKTFKENRDQYSVSDLKSGIYLIAVQQNNGKKMTFKLIKK